MWLATVARAASPPDVRKVSDLAPGRRESLGYAPAYLRSLGRSPRRNGMLFGRSQTFRTSGGEAAYKTGSAAAGRMSTPPFTLTPRAPSLHYDGATIHLRSSENERRIDVLA